MTDKKKDILTFGAGNAERLILVDEFLRGQKHVVEPSVLTAGGSAVNHACRLLAMGHLALPVMAIGDDEVGSLVIGTLLNAADRGDIPNAERDRLDTWMKALQQPGASTPYTTIVVERSGQRSIFTEAGTASARFPAICGETLARMEMDTVGCVLIGHIHSDAAAPGGNNGASTSRIIEKFAGRVPVVANFGRSQYRLGPRRWKAEITRVELFQLSFDEAVELALADGRKFDSLRELVEWYRGLDINHRPVQFLDA